MGVTGMLKALGRSAFITLILLALVALLSYVNVLHFNAVVIIVLAVVFIWFSVMLYLDPPDDWDN